MTKRIIRSVVTLILVISLFMIQASASWNVSAGGDGSGGKVSAGAWSQQWQGIRITILTPKGQPAFRFGEIPTGGSEREYARYSTDILIEDSTNSRDNVNIWMGGCKAFADGSLRNIPLTEVHKGTISGFDVDMLTKLKTSITTYNWINDGFRTIDGTTFYTMIAPPGMTESIHNEFNALKETAPIKEVGTGKNKHWQLQGAAIRNRIYGDENQKEPKLNAALYEIFNLYNSKSGYPVWKLTEQAKSELAEITGSDEVAKAYTAGFNWKGEGNTPTALSIMTTYGFYIVVEPILWVELRNTETEFGGFIIYGTPSNIAWAINKLVADGDWIQDNAEYGGYDEALTRATRHSFTLTKPITINGVTFNAPEGRSDTGTKVSNTTMLNHTEGWAMHIYECKPSSGTSTYDEPQGSNPAPAPDPLKLTPPADPAKDKINIVKTYQDKIIKADGTEEIKHKETFVRQGNPGKIQVEDEPEYRLKEWFISSSYSAPSSSTTWDVIKGNPVTGEAGTGVKAVEVKDPNTTLYAHININWSTVLHLLSEVLFLFHHPFYKCDT